jgi:hypothetical protein
MECRALGCLSFDHTMVFCVQRALHTIYLSFSRVTFLLSVGFLALGLTRVCGVVTVFEECEEEWSEKGMAE